MKSTSETPSGSLCALDDAYWRLGLRNDLAVSSLRWLQTIAILFPRKQGDGRRDDFLSIPAEENENAIDAELPPWLCGSAHRKARLTPQ